MKKVLSVLIIICIITLSGCKIIDKQVYVTSGYGFNNAFSYGSLKCPQNEAKLYLSAFKSYYGSIDDKDIKESTLSLMTKVYSLLLYAKENDISLDKSEVSDAAGAAKEFYSKMTEEEKNNTGISESDVKKAYENYLLSLKVYSVLMEGVNEEVTEDESRVMEGYVIFTTDETKVPDIESRIKAKDDFATLTQVFSEGDKRLITFGREEFPKEFDDVAFHLEEGEISDRIDTDEGIYYVQCVVKYDEAKSELNKSFIIDKRQKSLLTQIQAEQKEREFCEKNERFFTDISLDKIKIESGREFFVTIENRFKP